MTLVELLLVLMMSAAVSGLSGDTIKPGESLPDNETLVSAGRTFVLGFFTPKENSSLRYLGIWYNIDPHTVVWVANRDEALNSSSGILNLTADGKLMLLDSNIGKPFWSTPTANLISPIVQLTDAGNLVLNETNMNTIMWQSFDYPTNTLLPGMKLGVNLETGANKYLTSWKSDTDPSSGDYTYKMDANGVPELYLWKDDTIIYRSGPWNGHGFSGRPEMTSDNEYFAFDFISNQDRVYYMFEYKISSILSYVFITPDGEISRNYIYRNETNPDWKNFWSIPTERCDYYNQRCGTFEFCTGDKIAPCQCLDGFIPNNWTLRDYSRGCTRKKPLGCSGRDAFYKLQQIKLPDTSNATSNNSLNDCQSWCLNNCSCMAYAVTEETGCITWSGDLIDIRSFADSGDTMYIKVTSEPVKKHLLVIVVPAVIGSVLLVLLFLLLLWRNRIKRQGPGDVGTSEIREQQSLTTNIRREEIQNSLREQPSVMPGTEVEPTASQNIANPVTGSERMLGVLPMFDLASVKAATNGFSVYNAIGEGGYGNVYKGQLQNGQIVAVKRFIKLSLQGPDVFKNEVKLIANLQHINLIRLVGCCVEEDEKILILEYMENGSLDTYIFDKTKGLVLDWRRRLDIITGVAQGLLYLHRDSNLKVIHRDLKPSNILLDHDFNPRISDFGISKIFEGGRFLEKATSRPVGTLPYMAPEYITAGIFSFKSDVFSFGVILFEILSGRKHSLLNLADAHSNLLAYTYKLWKDGRSLEILDQTLGNSYPLVEIMRCIRVGLLCVEEKSEDRPTMAEVVRLLSSEDVMPSPKIGPISGAGRYTRGELSSSNDISVTLARR